MANAWHLLGTERRKRVKIRCLVYSEQVGKDERQVADHLGPVVMEFGFYFTVTESLIKKKKKESLIKYSHLIYNLQIESLLLDGSSVWIMDHRGWARAE